METKLATRKETGRKNVIIFGDSISYGELIAPSEIWVTRIARQVEQMFRGEFLLINSSINGNTTRLALERMPFDVQRYNVDLLVIQFGLNDCNYWRTDEGEPRVSLAAYQANLVEMISRGRRFGAKKVVLMTSHFTPHIERLPFAPLSYEDNRKRYNEAVREVAAECGCVLIDIEASQVKVFKNAVTAADALLLPDGIHLNRHGHDFYETNVEAVLIRELLEISVKSSSFQR